MMTNTFSQTNCHFPLYASQPGSSRGRLYHETRPNQSLTLNRSPYQHDRDRIIHARAFRRIKHKTQVFIAPEGDHYRTRLTHSLEVAQIARTLARALNINEDLTEAIALAHDIGHPPFGHVGEEILNQKMKLYGGFNHNLQALRIVVLLERQYPHFDGLNLTYETLDGLLKHNGPLNPKYHSSDIIQHLCQKTDFALHEFSCLEAQVAALADDVAYNSHDIDDGVRANFITLTDLQTVSYFKDNIKAIRHECKPIAQEYIVSELIRRQIGNWLEGILKTAQENLQTLAQKHSCPLHALTPNQIRKHNRAIIAFADKDLPHVEAVRQFLQQNVYECAGDRSRLASKVIKSLFDEFMTSPNELAPAWQNRWSNFDNDTGKARYVCDYIAGMTDSFALNEYQRIFGEALQ